MAVLTEPTDMAVVGHSVGDKRKIEHVEDMERLAKSDQDLRGQDSPATEKTKQDSTIQTTGAEEGGPTMAREDLHRQLREEAARKAARSRRSAPYVGDFHV